MSSSGKTDEATKGEGSSLRRPAWFQFHLSTAVVLMLVASGILWMNLQVKTTKVAGNGHGGRIDWGGSFELGWPSTYLERDVFLGTGDLDFRAFRYDVGIDEFLELQGLKGLSAWEVLAGTEGAASWSWQGMMLDGAVLLHVDDRVCQALQYLCLPVGHAMPPPGRFGGARRQPP